MTTQDAIKVLVEYNKWRMGADTKMPDPKVISEAIEIAIKELKIIVKK